MRAGEITSLTREDIDLEKRTAHLKMTKNGDERTVPLSERAIKILNNLPKLNNSKAPIFQLSAGSLSAIFRTHRNKTPIQNLTFHDTRHEATTRLAKKFHVLDLARITGHKNINELLTYYDKSAEDMAKELAENTATTSNSSAAIDYSMLAKEMFSI